MGPTEMAGVDLVQARAAFGFGGREEPTQSHSSTERGDAARVAGFDFAAVIARLEDLRYEDLHPESSPTPVVEPPPFSEPTSEAEEPFVESPIPGPSADAAAEALRRAESGTQVFVPGEEGPRVAPEREQYYYEPVEEPRRRWQGVRNALGGALAFGTGLAGGLGNRARGALDAGGMLVGFGWEWAKNTATNPVLIGGLLGIGGGVIGGELVHATPAAEVLAKLTIALLLDSSGALIVLGRGETVRTIAEREGRFKNAATSIRKLCANEVATNIARGMIGAGAGLGIEAISHFAYDVFVRHVPPVEVSSAQAGAGTGGTGVEGGDGSGGAGGGGGAQSGGDLGWGPGHGGEAPHPSGAGGGNVDNSTQWPTSGTGPGVGGGTGGGESGLPTIPDGGITDGGTLAGGGGGTVVEVVSPLAEAGRNLVTGTVWGNELAFVKQLHVSHPTVAANALKNLAYGLEQTAEFTRLGPDSMVNLVSRDAAAKIAEAASNLVGRDPSSLTGIQKALWEIAVSGRHATVQEATDIIGALTPTH